MNRRNFSKVLLGSVAIPALAGTRDDLQIATNQVGAYLDIMLTNYPLIKLDNPKSIGQFVQIHNGRWVCLTHSASAFTTYEEEAGAERVAKDLFGEIEMVRYDGGENQDLLQNKSIIIAPMFTRPDEMITSVTSRNNMVRGTKYNKMDKLYFDILFGIVEAHG